MADFRMALETNGLLDLSWKNQKFTWSNRHIGDCFTKEHLNRVVVNQLWLQNFRSMGVDVLISGHSEHLPILLNTSETANGRPTKRIPFWNEASGLKRMTEITLSEWCGKNR